MGISKGISKGNCNRLGNSGEIAKFAVEIC